jgi:multiple sugar transport system permease protein
MKRRSRSRVSWIVYLLLLVVVFWTLVPFVWMFSTSIKSSWEVFQTPVYWIPKEPTLEQYRTVWTLTDFPRRFWNSMTISICVTLISVLVSIFGGYALARPGLRAKDAFGYCYLVAQMLPAVLLIIPIFIMMRNAGLIDTYWCLILTYTSFAVPFCTWMMKGVFQSIPEEMEQAGMIDGCTPIGAMLRLTLPAAIPGVIATALFAFILCWNEFIFALTLTNSPSMRTLPVGIASYIGHYTVEWGLITAEGVLVSIPVAVGFAFLQKYLVQGLTGGAVKG